MAPVARGLLLLVAAVVLLGAGCLVYIGWRARQAEHAVEVFCASIEVGAPVAGVAERARKSGLFVREQPAALSTAPGALVCEQGVFLALHVCTIEHAAGRVLQKTRSFEE